MAKKRIRFSGIYRIECLGNGKFYVGSSKDILKRWKHHAYELRRNQHRATFLQRSYNKYGPDSLVFSVLQYVGYKVLGEAEKHWIDLLMPAFNTMPVSPTHLDQISNPIYVARLIDAKEKAKEIREAEKQLEWDRMVWNHNFGRKKY